MNTIQAVVNYLGVPIDDDFIKRLYDKSYSPNEFFYTVLNYFFKIPPENLPEDVIERYNEISKKENYHPILPHTDKLFERLLSPYKSSKRCYCFGEYLASIELSAHIGEMLAILVWVITPKALSGNSINKEAEKNLFGKEFEKQGQDRRIRILKAINAITEEDRENLDSLRTTRRKYFHLWSESTENLKNDSMKCFFSAGNLLKSVLKIGFQDGVVYMNPHLDTYLRSRNT